jgi:hypothetical protein
LKHLSGKAKLQDPPLFRKVPRTGADPSPGHQVRQPLGAQMSIASRSFSPRADSMPNSKIRPTVLIFQNSASKIKFYFSLHA